jgi:hypothetical protein
MGRVNVSIDLPGQVSTAEALWYDLRRWAGFVDGFAHVRKVEGDWPREGAVVQWQSVPDGRGLVQERVTRFEVRAGQTVEIEDAQITGEQKVTFAPAEDGCKLTVELEYKLKTANVLTPIVVGFFVRRAFTDATRRTLARFRRELAGDLALAREEV